MYLYFIGCIYTIYTYLQRWTKHMWMVYATNKIQIHADINLQVYLHEHAGLLYDIKASLLLSMPYTLQPVANCRHYNIVVSVLFFWMHRSMWCCEHACACEILLTESVPALHPALYAYRDVSPVFCNYVVHEQQIQRFLVWSYGLASGVRLTELSLSY